MKDDGSGRKIAVHAAIGGLMSQITGAGFAAGAVGAGLNEALINSLKGLDPGTAQIVSAIVGAAAAKAASENAAADASAAAAGTKWNYLLEWQYRRMREELSKAATEEEEKAVYERWKEIDKAQENRMQQDMFKDEYVIRPTDSKETVRQKEKNFRALHGDLHYKSIDLPVTIISRGETRADSKSKEAINRILFTPLLQLAEFGWKVSEFNKGFTESITKNLTPSFQFDPNPAKKHYTFETREHILGRIVGDGVSFLIGATEFLGGATLAAGGSTAATASGVGIAAAPAVAAAGAAIALHGGTTVIHVGQNFAEDISRFKASTSGNGSVTPPKLDTIESTVKKLNAGAKDTTVSRHGTTNMQKSGGYEQALKEFNNLQLKNVKKIQTQYGDGFVGELSDGTRVVVRRESETGGPTVEIQASKRIKYRY